MLLFISLLLLWAISKSLLMTLETLEEILYCGMKKGRDLHIFFRYYDKTLLCIVLNFKNRAPFLPEMPYTFISREYITQLLSKINDIRRSRY